MFVSVAAAIQTMPVIARLDQATEQMPTGMIGTAIILRRGAYRMPAFAGMTVEE
ncbi:MAG: hypothetical protein P4M05_17975 [Bradyrhizobium sp.]|nr:hypothetical protein [Bradyrhizobium sp.]